MCCYIYSELKSANDTYSAKLSSEKHKDKDMISLSWKIKELSDLNDMGRKLREEFALLTSGITGSQCFWQEENVPSRLKDTRKKMVSFV